jgi:general secretion pathway protein I
MSLTQRQPIGRQGGFMMLEVMIAFVIATLALGVIIGAATGSLHAAQIAARYDEATVRAQSRLAEAVNGGALTPGDREGSDGGGYRWHLRVTLAPGAELRPVSDGALPETLYAVTVWITWRDGTRTRDVRLDTERIGQSIQAP